MELFYTIRPDDRCGYSGGVDQPGQRDLRHAFAMRLPDRVKLVDQIEVALVLELALDLLALLAATATRHRLPAPVFAGQKTTSQRTIRDHAQPLISAQRL